MSSISMPCCLSATELKKRWRHSFIVPLFMAIAGSGLGLLFLYAGGKKYLHPFEFAQFVLDYELFPQIWVGFGVAILPLVEFISGSLLVLGYILGGLDRLATKRGWASRAYLVDGLKRRSCLLLILGQSIMFTSVLIVTLLRGLKIDCGCGLFFQREVGLVPIMEDALLVLLAAGLYWWEFPIGKKETLPPS
ncbi:MAG: hypothetical protein QME75_03950 [Deltaproteobacteria bacterium]|nr:hypothetical protein [Deltaproteobacteria bacterium]